MLGDIGGTTYLSNLKWECEHEECYSQVLQFLSTDDTIATIRTIGAYIR